MCVFTSIDSCREASGHTPYHIDFSLERLCRWKDGGKKQGRDDGDGDGDGDDGG